MPLEDPKQGLCSQGAPGVIVRGVAHDYRNRLQTIFSALGLIKESASSGRIADIVSIASAAQGLLKGAGDLTSNVLSATCPPHWELERVEINGALDALEPVLSALCARDVDLRLDLLDRDISVLCSPRLFENAIINLVINADHAIDGPGSITIATSSFDPIRCKGQKEERDTAWPIAAISVSDTGHGISNESLRRAFSPEYTTKAASGGAGLGLMMTRLFADQAGGTVKAHSVVGAGTSISLLLPEAVPAALHALCHGMPGTALFS